MKLLVLWNVSFPPAHQSIEFTLTILTIGVAVPHQSHQGNGVTVA
jgi:hypothetical protein